MIARKEITTCDKEENRNVQNQELFDVKMTKGKNSVITLIV